MHAAQTIIRQVSVREGQLEVDSADVCFLLPAVGLHMVQGAGGSGRV
jgi:hypothetical protein